MWKCHFLFYIAKHLCIGRAYWTNRAGLNDESTFINFIWTRLFSIQMIDYVNLCYVVEAFLKKNIIQINAYKYLLLYTIFLDSISIYLENIFEMDRMKVVYNLGIHLLCIILEIIYLKVETSVYGEDFNLQYFKRFGASTFLNRAFITRENLMLCIRVGSFSQYIVIVNHFLGVHKKCKFLTILMWINTIHMGCILASFSAFKKKEDKIIRFIQLCNLGLALIIRIFSFLSVISFSLTLDMIDFHCTSILEIVVTSITFYFAFKDYENFDKGLITKD